MSLLQDWLIGPFADFAFMRRALIGCIAVSLGAAPCGVFLTLRGLALTGDAMAHAILPGAALGYLLFGLSLPAMSLGGLAAGLLVALLSGLTARLTPAREDSTLASWYLISLASGVLLLSLGGSSVDLFHVLFGNVLGLDPAALVMLATIASLSLCALALLWRPLVADSVDPLYLRAVGAGGVTAHLLFQMLVVLNLVGGFQALGTLMAVGLMMLPAAAARFWTRGLPAMVLLATLFALTASLSGMLLSFHLDLPSGPAVVLMAGSLYLISALAGSAGGLRSRLSPPRHLAG